MKNIAIVDYGSGNLHSAKKAFQKAAEEIYNNKFTVNLTSNPQDLDYATHIVLPGVGAFGDCIQGLKSISGMIESLEKNILKNKKPFFGICVGMQMLAERGLEKGEHKGLGWIPGTVRKIKTLSEKTILPHMGWNNIEIKNNDETLFREIDNNSNFYFVHSYCFQTDKNNVIATTNYDEEITAIIKKDNIIGCQFHPEKSQRNGLKLITNFLKM